MVLSVSPSASTVEEFADDESRQALLVSLVASSDDAIYSKTVDGVITSWNPAAETIYGYTADEMIGRDASVLIHKDWVDDTPNILKRIRAGERINHYETVRRRKDGRIMEVSLSVSPIHDGDGHLVGASSIARDITERTRSQYARSLIEASLDPLVTISVEGKINDVNEATIRVTGVPRDQLIGTDFSDYFTEPARAREGYQLVSAGSVTDYPLTIRHRNGNLTDVLYSASVYKDAAGAVIGVFAAARDVSAQKRAETEVAQQRTKELERLAELERFQKLTVGRELKMIELKKEIEELNNALSARISL
jgi:PAS domain S-box-containing protein